MKRIVLVFLLGSILLAACEAEPEAPAAMATIEPGETTVESTLEPTETLATAVQDPDMSIARPFPQHVQYAPDSILPDQRSQAQLDDDLRAFYDYWKAAYVVEAGVSGNGTTMYRVAFGKEGEAYNRTVSEGQGYGMMILPIMAGYDPEARAIFDGLWAFARSHPSEVDGRLMDWNVPDDNGNASAFDGDVDMALGLLLADAQWGSEGVVDYQAEAQTLIAAILESTIGEESHLPMLGDWVQQNGNPYNQYTPRASDFVLVNFRAFGKETADPVWNDVVVQSQTLMLDMQTNFSPQTGLLPDFIVREETGYQPAQPNFLENVTDGSYGYNAGRIPWRVGLDALLSDDAASITIVQQISYWMEANTGGVPENIQAGYALDGTETEGRDYFTTFFAAPLGVAAMTDPDQQAWLNAIYDVVSNRQENYYEDTVNLLCLMVMTGNFWVP